MEMIPHERCYRNRNFMIPTEVDVKSVLLLASF